MPSNKLNMIDSLRAKHDPHFKLSANVDLNHKIIHQLENKTRALEKKVTDLPKIHKTLSKSFGMQRKTLTRVLGLEKRVAELEVQREVIQDVVEEVEEAAEAVEEVAEELGVEDEIPEGLDDVLDDIRGEGIEEEVGGEEPSGAPRVATLTDPPKTTPKKKKPRIRIRKKKIRAADIKKGTPFDKGYASRVMGQDETGEYLSKAERIRRFKGGAITKPDDLKSDSEETPTSAEVDTEKSQEGLLPILKSISSSVDGIKQTLIGQAEVSKDQAEFLRKQQENKKRNKRESGLEKMLGGVKKVGQMALKPVIGIWEKIFNFLTMIFIGRIAMQLWGWFSDPANTDKISSLFRFIKDWWPVILASLMAFLPGLLGPAGLILGTIALLSWGIPKIVNAVKSIFGFGDKIDKELKEGEDNALKDSEKLESQLDKDLKNELGEDQPSKSETPNEIKDANKQDTSKLKEPGQDPVEMNKGGEVPGSGNTDTVPAMLTPGEFVMTKEAVQKYGLDTLEGLNAAAGGTNIPTVQKGGGKGMNMMIPRFSGGGKATGVVTDPKKKKEQEDYMLHWVNKERVEFLGLPPLDKLTYAQGVELTEMMGPGPKTTETTDTHFDFDKMLKTTSRTKTRGDESISDYSVGILTEEDKQQYLASNPSARLAQDLMNQFELDSLGADISASAKMNGGGLVQGFNNGGLVQGFNNGGFIKGISRIVKKAGDVGGSVVRSGLKMSGMQNTNPNIIPPATPNGRKITTVAIPSPGSNTVSKPVDNGGKKIPTFSASAKNSPRKIKTLGITL